MDSQSDLKLDSGFSCVCIFIPVDYIINYVLGKRKIHRYCVLSITEIENG